MTIPAVRFGVSLPYRSSDFNSIARYIVVVMKSRNIDSLWIPDHHYLPWEALTTLSAIAVKTEKVRLGTCVVDLNRRNPATMAQMASTLDNISAGRFILGVGKGSANQRVYGASLDRPVSRACENIEIVKKFWTESPVNYVGHFYRFEDAYLEPKPLQKPHPPIWVAAFGPGMMKIAAELGNGLITQNLPPEVLADELKKVNVLARRRGRDPNEIIPVFAAPIALSVEHDVAERHIETMARRQLMTLPSAMKSLIKRGEFGTDWNRPEDVPLDVIKRCYIYGTPDECIGKIESYKKAGVRYFISLPLLPTDEDSAKLFADKVAGYFAEP